MPPVLTSSASLAGIVLADAVSGAAVDLGAGPPLAVLTAIRHRH